MSKRVAASATDKAAKDKGATTVTPIKNYGEIPDPEFTNDLNSYGVESKKMIEDALNVFSPMHKKPNNGRDSDKFPITIATTGTKSPTRVQYNDKGDFDISDTESSRRRGRSRILKLGEMRRREKSLQENHEMDD